MVLRIGPWPVGCAAPPRLHGLHVAACCRLLCAPCRCPRRPPLCSHAPAPSHDHATTPRGAALEGIRMKEALKTAMLVSKAGNLFFQVRGPDCWWATAGAMAASAMFWAPVQLWRLLPEGGGCSSGADWCLVLAHASCLRRRPRSGWRTSRTGTPAAVSASAGTAQGHMVGRSLRRQQC